VSETYRATLEIAKINNSFKIKVGMILRSDNTLKFPKVIDKFSYNGNDYFKINPKPFVVFDISHSSANGDGWNANQSVSLNRNYLFFFCQALSGFVKKYQSEKQLFFYTDNKLTVNAELADRIQLTVKNGNNKTIRMRPCVVQDEQNPEVVYEGCIFYINTMDNFAYLTYSEMEYLLWESMHIDLTAISFSIMQLARLYDGELIDKRFKSPRGEPPEQVMPGSNNSFVIVKDPKNIPKI
jgi:hypothetical protein